MIGEGNSVVHDLKKKGYADVLVRDVLPSRHRIYGLMWRVLNTGRIPEPGMPT